MDFDRPDSVDSSDCSNHSTTTSTTDKSDKDTEPSSDSECKVTDPCKTQTMWKNNISFVTKGTVFSSGSSQGSILSPPLFSQNPFAVRRSTPTRTQADSTQPKPLLTPSKLTGVQESASMSNVSSSSKLVLRPSALADQASKLSTYTKNCNADSNNGLDIKEDSKDDSFKSEDVGNTLMKMSDDPISRKIDLSACTSSSKSFVFGQNIEDRVQNARATSSEASCVVPSNGSSDLLFTSAMKYADSISEDHNKTEGIACDKTKTLTENAREYEESKQVKRKYEEIEVITGEENESNVLQMMCKLFAYDKNLGSYQEKGRGILRVNDMQSNEDCLQSRIVVRTQGSLRLMLNTLVWAGMKVEKPSLKTVRFTALDNDVMKIFLISGNPKDVDLMYNALHYRVMELKKHEKTLDLCSEQPEDSFPSSTCSPSHPVLCTEDCEVSSCKRQCKINVASGNRHLPMIQKPEVDSSNPNDPTDHCT